MIYVQFAQLLHGGVLYLNVASSLLSGFVDQRADFFDKTLSDLI